MLARGGLLVIVVDIHRKPTVAEPHTNQSRLRPRSARAMVEVLGEALQPQCCEAADLRFAAFASSKPPTRQVFTKFDVLLSTTLRGPLHEIGYFDPSIAGEVHMARARNHVPITLVSQCGGCAGDQTLPPPTDAAVPASWYALRSRRWARGAARAAVAAARTGGALAFTR